MTDYYKVELFFMHDLDKTKVHFCYSKIGVEYLPSFHVQRHTLSKSFLLISV